MANRKRDLRDLRVVSADSEFQPGEPARESADDRSAGEATVAAFLEEWLESVEYAMRPRSWQRYRQNVRLHATPIIGHLPLVSLHPKDLQQLYADRRRAGLSGTSILHLHNTLHQALSRAQSWGLVNDNVARHVNPPRRDSPEVHPFSPEEAERFLTAVRGDRLEALYVLAITTGMRQGELLALRWQDVDLERHSIRVTASLQFLRGKGLTLAPPKSRKSRRNVLLTELAVDALQKHRRRQEEQRSAKGDRWQEGNYVFTNSRNGGPTYASVISDRSLPRILQKAGLRKIRFHDLRHTTATLLLGQGVHPKIVSEMLGHSNIGITLDLYSHASPTMQETATTALDELLGGTTGP